MKVCKDCRNHVWGDCVTYLPQVCIDCKYVEVNGEKEPSNWKPRPMTNADRIRAMSDEELAERLIFWNDDWGRWETDAGNFAGDPNDTKETAIKAELEWLKQPSEVDNG